MILRIIKKIIIFILIIFAFIGGCYLAIKKPDFVQYMFDKLKGIKK
jgi:thioredoxin-related protein